MMRGFDSIESMNSAEEVLVKRKKGSKKFMVSALIVGGLFFLVGILIGLFSHDSHPPNTDNTTSPTLAPSAHHHKFVPDEYIIENVNGDSMKENLRILSSNAKLPGTPAGHETAKSIHSLWTSYGLDDVHIESYKVALSFPNQTNPNKVVLYNKISGEVSFESSPLEPPLRKEDNETSIPAYNAFCASGNVIGEVVYVNYGRIEDLKYLSDTLSLELTQRIFMARYGKISCSDKVMNAALFNASGVIFYADPGDSNLNQPGDEKPYPDSWWLPDSGVQRENVLTGSGDVDTPGYPAKEYAFRHKESERKLSKIPCQPISFGDAVHILRNLSGSLSPPDWHGTLPIDYRTGPGWTDGTEMTLRLVVNNFINIRPIDNVIGIIKGNIEPDRYILLGNHHDALTLGAVDAGSGVVALNQVVSIFADFLKKGYRPRRTIIFCSWDASEQGHIGSVEWVEDHLKTLQKGAIAYLNVDMVAAGHFTLFTAVSPLLTDSVYESARKVPSPHDEFKSLYEFWLAHPLSEEKPSYPKVYYPFASDSDHKVFYQQVGLSSSTLSMTFDKRNHNMSKYPMYHTGYETSYLYEQFHDPGFKFTVALTQMWALMAYDLASSPLIPFKMSRFSKSVEDFLHQILTTYKDSFRENQINTDFLTSAVGHFSKAITEFESQLSNEKKWDQKPLKLRIYNDKMMHLESMFLHPEGLPDQPQIKNLIFGNTCFQSIHDAMNLIDKGKGSWDRLKEQISLLTFYFERAACFLGEIGL